MPVSPIYLFGVTDGIVYRRMLGQGFFDSTGGVLSVALANQESGGETLSLLNFGLLTAVHIIPGFLWFLGIT